MVNLLLAPGLGRCTPLFLWTEALPVLELSTNGLMQCVPLGFEHTDFLFNPINLKYYLNIYKQFLSLLYCVNLVVGSLSSQIERMWSVGY